MSKRTAHSPLGLGESSSGQRVLRVCAGGLLFATGAVHLYLYLTGYRTIPTIGWLFLLQVMTAFGLGTIVILSQHWLAWAASAGFVMSTLVGYLVSLRLNLFGFHEVRTTAGLVAAVIEIAAFAALASLALNFGDRRGSLRTAPDQHHSMTDHRIVVAGRWVVGVLAVVASVVFGVLFAAAGPASMIAGASTVHLKTADVHGVTVLTNARGFTLYWFAPDTLTKSVCYGTCAAYWPPVVGTPSSGTGIVGRVGTIRRSNRATQVTYDNHPLYTYVGDSALGQANGNRIDLNGGWWYEMKVSG